MKFLSARSIWEFGNLVKGWENLSVQVGERHFNSEKVTNVSGRRFSPHICIRCNLQNAFNRFKNSIYFFGKLNNKARPRAAGSGFHSNDGSMGVGHFLDDGKPKPAAVAIGAHHPVKALENVVPFLR